MRVLVVDDDPALRAMWIRTGEDHGVVVRAMPDLASARLALMSWPGFDRVICDWNLGDGTTTRMLVQELLDRGADVAVVTGDPQQVRVELGAPVVVHEKPLAYEQVVRLLGGSPLPSPSPRLRPRLR